MAAVRKEAPPMAASPADPADMEVKFLFALFAGILIFRVLVNKVFRFVGR